METDSLSYACLEALPLSHNRMIFESTVSCIMFMLYMFGFVIDIRLLFRMSIPRPSVDFAAQSNARIHR
jgi:hypothetical protein